LHDHANDEGVFALIDDWISDCARNHHSCTIYRLNSNPGYVPARLIYIENRQLRPGSFHTQNEQQLRPKLCRRGVYGYGEDYIALSHCWGANPELVPGTTTANIDSREMGIPWSDLTKTFQDAMEITVRMGKSYVWIDSLCIVQDDFKDLEVHCESMSQIYSNSYCTISATGAMDGTQGCFLPRRNVRMRPCVIRPLVHSESIEGRSNPRSQSLALAAENPSLALTLASPTDNIAKNTAEEFPGNIRIAAGGQSSNKDNGHAEIYDEDETNGLQVFTVLPTFREWTHSMKGPLLSRGWTLQERELSVRVLHFTADRVVWECRERYASEDDPMQKAKSMLFDVGLKFRLLDGNMRDRKNRPYNYKFSKWMDLVEEYSTRKLSIESDKLRAIAGLADAIKSIQQDDMYISGLWKRDLLQQLLWFSIPNPQHPNSQGSWRPAPVPSRIPTWSWAAYNGAVVFDRSHQYKPNGFPKPTVTNATSSLITLSGPALEIPFSTDRCDSSEMGINQINRKYYKWTQEDSRYEIYIAFDAEPKSPQELRLLCLVLFEHGAKTPIPRTGNSPASLPTYAQSSVKSNPQVRPSISASPFSPG
jgi:hypothetical protein